MRRLLLSAIAALVGLAFHQPKASGQATPPVYSGIYEATLASGARIVLAVDFSTSGRAFFYSDGPALVSRSIFDIDSLGNSTISTPVGNLNAHFSEVGFQGTLGSEAVNAPRTQFVRDVDAQGFYLGQALVAPGAGTASNGSMDLLLTPGGNYYLWLFSGPTGETGTVGTWTPDPAAPEFQAQLVGTYPAGNAINGTVDSENGSLLGQLALPSIGGQTNFTLIKGDVNFRLVNISTRGRVGTGDDRMIAGFIIKNGPKRVLIRALGPSLAQFNIASVLANPKMELHSKTELLLSNDDWQDGNDVATIEAFGLAPSNDSESVLLVTLDEGPYTVVVGGVGGTTGVALIEVYEIN